MKHALVLALLILLLCIKQEIFSQIQGTDTQTNLNAISHGSGMFRSFDNRFKGIEGYPTLFSKYLSGKVYLVSGLTINHDSINFDVYNNDLLVKRNNIETIVNKAMVAGFSLELQNEVKYFTKLRDKEGNYSFYEILVKDKVKLYKRTIKTISGPTKQDAYSIGRLFSVFEEKVKLYTQKDGGELTELKSKKQLLEQFSDKEEFIVKFMKEKKISIKDEKECAKLIEFINTLF